MDFFGIGTWELLLILLVALIFLGPGKLPEMARTLGRFVRQLRSLANEATRTMTVELEKPESKAPGQATSRATLEPNKPEPRTSDQATRSTTLEPEKPETKPSDQATAQDGGQPRPGSA